MSIQITPYCTLKTINPVSLHTRLFVLITRILLFSLLASFLVFSAPVFADSQLSHKSIGISQIIEHEALDIVRNSLIEALKKEGFEAGKNLTIHVENAHGNMVTSTQIASKLMALNLDVDIGISTASTQSLLQAAQKQGLQVPIVFTAVTDPKNAKLTPDITGYPITGITDAPNLTAFMELLHSLLPNLKRLGVLYNPSEANSVSTVNHLKKRLKEQGITLVEATVNTTAEVPNATKSLMGKVDALYFPQDNTVVAAMQSVLKIANQPKQFVPVILPIYSDNPNILKGILAANGYDYKDIGQETGLIIAEILKGKNAKKIPIHSPKFTKTLINEKLAKKLGLSIPKELQHSVLTRY